MCASQDLYDWIVNGIELPFLLQLETDFKVFRAVKILSFCQKYIKYYVSEVIKFSFLGTGKPGCYREDVAAI